MDIKRFYYFKYYTLEKKLNDEQYPWAVYCERPPSFIRRGGEPKIEVLLYQSTVDIHFQNAHKTLFQSTVDIHF